jgi:hypothetical protein
VGSDIDTVSLFRNRINSLLTTASWVEDVKRLLGITGVSPIWDDTPAWYFWIEGAPGVYSLVLERTWTDGSHESGPFHGLFSVKCYPFQASREFATFSFFERHLIASKLFDSTNTPRFESRSSIPASLFVVGAIECVVQGEGHCCTLTLESPDLMRARYEAEALEDYPLIDWSHFYRVGEVGRKIPGWDLSYILFDRLVSLWAHNVKAKPLRVVLETSPGFEYVYNVPADWRCVEADEIAVRSLEVLFPEELGRDEVRKVLASVRTGPGITVLYDGNSQCACTGHVKTGFRDGQHLNPLWWNIPEMDFKSELSSTCGCT